MQDLTKRTKKGNSILKKTYDYTVIDIETTGLCPAIDEIIEIGALKVRNNIVVDKFSQLIKPRFPIPSFITDINHITNEMVEDAPVLSEVVNDFFTFVENDELLGFNTSFDINFLYDACHAQGLDLTNDYIDSRKIAKIVLPNFKEETRRRYKLKNFVWYFKFGKQEHRALSDCIYTKQLYDKLNEIAEEKNIDYSSTIIRSNWNANDIKRQNADITLFNGEKFVFTGKLEYMPRKEAMQYVVDFGGAVADRLTKDVDYLVMGTQDYSRLSGEKSNKQIQAEKYRQQGEDINIITEDIFYEMIDFSPSADETRQEENIQSYWPTFELSEDEKNAFEQKQTEEYLSQFPEDQREYIREKINQGLVKLY